MKGKTAEEKEFALVENMANEVEFVHDYDGGTYKVIAPDYYTEDQVVVVIEELLATLQRRFFRRLTEYEVRLPMPEEFYIGDTRFTVEEVC